jgi:hypothetical protein
MAAIPKFSAQVIDYAERLSGMADAAEGRRPRSGGAIRRWVALPASGAALYALVKSDFFSRQAKDVIDEAKTRASELPDDLVARVRETVEEPTGNGSRKRRPSTRSTRARSKRKASSTPKAKAAGR